MGRHLYNERGWISWLLDCVQTAEKRGDFFSSTRPEHSYVHGVNVRRFTHVWLCWTICREGGEPASSKTFQGTSRERGGKGGKCRTKNQRVFVRPWGRILGTKSRRVGRLVKRAQHEIIGGNGGEQIRKWYGNSKFGRVERIGSWGWVSRRSQVGIC